MINAADYGFSVDNEDNTVALTLALEAASRKPDVDSTSEESVDKSLRLERVYLADEIYQDFVFFRGTREAFAAQFASVLTRFNPELVARFPSVNVQEDTYGFIGGTVVITRRDDQPFFWVGLPGTRHLFIENLIKECGTADEKLKVRQFKKGFVTNTGRFVSRMSAKSIAKDAGQLLPTAEKFAELFSDNIW